MDPVGLHALLDAIRDLHALDAKWVQSVPVREVHGGLVVWDGEVQVFDVRHPKASRVYAWSQEGEGGRRTVQAVLGAPPVDSALDAVRVAIVGEFKNSAP